MLTAELQLVLCQRVQQLQRLRATPPKGVQGQGDVVPSVLSLFDPSVGIHDQEDEMSVGPE